MTPGNGNRNGNQPSLAWLPLPGHPADPLMDLLVPASLPNSSQSAASRYVSAACRVSLAGILEYFGRCSEPEREFLCQALERTSGNKTSAARLLGLSRDTMRYRLEKYGIQ